MYDLSRELERLNVVSEISDCEEFLIITLRRKHALQVKLVEERESQLKLFRKSIESLNYEQMFKEDYLNALKHTNTPSPTLITEYINADIEGFIEMYHKLENLD